MKSEWSSGMDGGVWPPFCLMSKRKSCARQWEQVEAGLLAALFSQECNATARENLYQASDYSHWQKLPYVSFCAISYTRLWFFHHPSCTLSRSLWHEKAQSTFATTMLMGCRTGRLVWDSVFRLFGLWFFH